MWRLKSCLRCKGDMYLEPVQNAIECVREEWICQNCGYYEVEKKKP